MIKSTRLGRAGNGHLGGALAASLGDAAAIGKGGGRGGAHGQRQAHGFDDAGHGARGPHHHAGADGRSEAAADEFGLGNVDDAGTVLPPKAAAIGAGAEDFALMMAHHHGPGGHDDGGQIDAGSGHDLGGEGLVAATDQHHRIHGLGTNHFLGVHGHEVAQEHGGGMGETFADGNGGEHHRQTAREQNAALYAFDQVGHIAVAGIVVTEGVGHTDDGAIERVIGISGGFDEGFAQE